MNAVRFMLVCGKEKDGEPRQSNTVTMMRESANVFLLFVWVIKLNEIRCVMYVCVCIKMRAFLNFHEKRVFLFCKVLRLIFLKSG